MLKGGARDNETRCGQQAENAYIHIDLHGEGSGVYVYVDMGHPVGTWSCDTGGMTDLGSNGNSQEFVFLASFACVEKLRCPEIAFCSFSDA